MRFLLPMIRAGLILMLFWVGLGAIALPVQAGTDPYVLRYLLDKGQPVALKLDPQGNTRVYSGDDFTAGKQLYSQNCKNCHVGGLTIPNPSVSLSLADFQGATPPRDNIQSLMDFSRRPMTYDGQDDAYLCRDVSPTWLADDQLEKLAAFILRAAEKGPGWGSETF